MAVGEGTEILQSGQLAPAVGEEGAGVGAPADGGSDAAPPAPAVGGGGGGVGPPDAVEPPPSPMEALSLRAKA
eukprot:3406088-Alexandrium_andersonii.AAC.1